MKCRKINSKDQGEYWGRKCHSMPLGKEELTTRRAGCNQYYIPQDTRIGCSVRAQVKYLPPSCTLTTGPTASHTWPATSEALLWRTEGLRKSRRENMTEEKFLGTISIFPFWDCNPNFFWCWALSYRFRVISDGSFWALPRRSIHEPTTISSKATD